jgi:Na+-driven multidrug efflux pump
MASALAATVGAVFYTSLTGGRRSLMTTYRPFRFRSLAHGRIRRLLGRSAPSAARGAVTMLGFLLFLGLHSMIGTRVTAAGTILAAVASAGFLPAIGLGVAIRTLVERSSGRDQKALILRGIGLTCGALLLPCMILLAFPDSIVGALTPDGRVVQLARPAARILALAILFDAIPTVWVAGVRGAAATRWMAAAGPVAQYSGLGLAWLLGVHLEWGLTGLWLALPASRAAVAIAAWWGLRGAFVGEASSRNG